MLPEATSIELDCWPTRPACLSNLALPDREAGSQGRAFNHLGVMLWAIAGDLLMHPSSGSLTNACWVDAYCRLLLSLLPSSRRWRLCPGRWLDGSCLVLSCLVILRTKYPIPSPSGRPCLSRSLAHTHAPIPLLRSNPTHQELSAASALSRPHARTRARTLLLPHPHALLHAPEGRTPLDHTRACACILVHTYVRGQRPPLCASLRTYVLAHIHGRLWLGATGSIPRLDLHTGPLRALRGCSTCSRGTTGFRLLLGVAKSTQRFNSVGISRVGAESSPPSAFQPERPLQHSRQPPPHEKDGSCTERVNKTFPPAAVSRPTVIFLGGAAWITTVKAQRVWELFPSRRALAGLDT